MVPTSSGAKSRVTAIPSASRLPPAPAGWAALRVNTVACGLSTPSVPPDHTNAIRLATSSAELPRRRAKASDKEKVAKPRVKSLAPPLPSVFPISATISRGSMVPASIIRSRPETSFGLLISNLWTPMRMVNSPFFADTLEIFLLAWRRNG